MKRLIQLVPRLSGVGAVLFAGSALAAQMYLNPLAGEDSVPARTYGAVEANAEAGITAYAGLTLPAPIAATSFSTRGNIPTSSPGISDTSFTNIIKKVNGATDTATHTVAGWFKIDNLPSSGNYQMLWAAVSYAGDHGGYRVCVNPAGEIAIGKISGSTYAFQDKDGNMVEPLLTSGAAIPAGTWFHLAVAITKTDNARTATPTVFVNGKLVPQATTGTFATNLNGNNCTSVVTGMGISAAGFYVDGEAIKDAATIRSWAVNPAKNIYVDKWTRVVPGGDGWLPNVDTNYYWSGENVDASAVQPLVYRGEATLSVTTTTEASASTISLNASPSLTAFKTAYGTSGAGTLTVASGSNTLTAATTTISAKTVLSGTGFSLGNLSITSTGTLTVGDNRTNFTVTAIDESGKLIVTPTATEIANGRITFNVGESVTLSTENVKVTGYNTFTATGGTITLPIPTWTPTTDNTSWDSNWSGTLSDGGSAILDLSHLTAAQTVTIPASVNLSTTSIIGASESVQVTIESGARLGTLTVQGKATLPAAIPATSVILETGAVLSLSGEGTLSAAVSGAGALRIASGTTTLSQANNYTGGTTIETGATVVLGNTNALGTTANVTGGGTIESASLPACNLTNEGWTGTLKLTDSCTYQTNMDWSSYGNANSFFEIPEGKNISGHFKNQSLQFDVNVILDGSVTINDGYTANGIRTYTFSGALSGRGSFNLSASVSLLVRLQDVTAFTGTLSTSSAPTFIVGTGHTYNSSNDGGKIVITGTLKSDAVRNWSATNRISVEGTLTTSLSEEEATNGYTLSGVTVASGGKVRFVRPDKWVVEATTNVYDPERASYVAEWTGGGDDTNWNTVANWACNGQTVTVAPGTSLASLTVAAGKTVTLTGAVTVDSLTTQGDFTLAGATDTSLTAKAVTLGGAVTLNAPLVLDLASALETDQTITVNESGALTTSGTVSLTNANCAFSGSLTVESGTLTWQYTGDNKEISGAVTVKEGATFATVSDYKYPLTLKEGNLSGAGTVRVKVPTESGQHDGARFLNLQGACTGFTGTVELEITVTGATSNSETMPRRTSVVIKPSDNVFNGSIDVVKVAGSSPFGDTNTDVAEGLWPYSKIFFANNCTFTGTIGGQGTVYIGRTGDRGNTQLLASEGASSVGTVTLTNQLATYAGSIAIPDADSTLLIQPTEAVTFAGKLSGAGKLDVETAQAVTLTGDLSGFTGSLKLIAESSLTLDTASTMVLSGQLNGWGSLTLGGSHGKPTVALSGANGDYYGVVTVASNAVLTNAGSSATVPFGKGRIENNGTVKLMSTTGTNGQLPPTSGSGKVEVTASCKIPAALTVEGSLTIGENCTVTLDCNKDGSNNLDFKDETPKINGPSVSLATGATIALGTNKTSGSLIIPANRTLSGTGTINVPVTFENDATATMDSNANITFGSTLTVPKKVTLLGTVTLAEGATLSGLGKLLGAFTCQSGATVEAGPTLSGSVTFAGGAKLLAKLTDANLISYTLQCASKPTFEGTVKISIPGYDLSVIKAPGLELSNFVVDEMSEKNDVQLRLVADAKTPGVLTLMTFRKPVITGTPNDMTAEEKEILSDRITNQFLEAAAQYGMVVSPVSASADSTKPNAKVEGALLFEHVVNVGFVENAEGTFDSVAVVSYDFGVADMTIKSLQLEGGAATMYVLLAAKVQNSADSNTASFAEGTKLTVLNGFKEITPTKVSAAVATGVADAAETTGVQWLAVPLATLFPDNAPTGTQALKVKASKTTTAN